MISLKEVQSSNLGLPEDSYIYSFAEVAATAEPGCASSLAVISSDNSLRIFNVDRLNARASGVFQPVHSSVTSLARFSLSSQSPLLLTAGRDGYVRGWDPRSEGKAVELAAPKGEPLSALACNASQHAVVAGTELEQDGPGDVNIYGWDIRKGTYVVLNYAESHTDTITELGFLRLNGLEAATLFSGSTDGLINIFDTSKTDEDEALLQVINHRSAIHHAGCLEDSIYALGTDETLSFYGRITLDAEDDRQPVHLGDVREPLECHYVVNILQTAGPSILVSGNHSERPRVDLMPLLLHDSRSPLSYAPTLQQRTRLEGAHGSEVVRDTIIEGNTVFTCGEDGMVRTWKG